MLFASVQSLARPATLAALSPSRFDYVVIDEVHHADASSYRRLLAHFTPRFLLGLTATPDRADGGDVPELSAALETRGRMEKLWSVWHEPEKAGTRTMVFCASIRHSEFVRDWPRARGVRVRLCHGGPDSDDRAGALQALEAGDIDAICSVDLFNEGIDCRPLDRVVMLRPTESPVLFLQQLGRGLRTSVQKQRLVVLDFVGNHKVFLDRLRILLSLGGGQPALEAFLATRNAPLPPGCSLNFELEAIHLLERLLPVGGGAHALAAHYRSLKTMSGARPTAGELVRRGGTLGKLLAGHGGWFGFVKSENDLESWATSRSWRR